MAFVKVTVLLAAIVAAATAAVRKPAPAAPCVISWKKPTKDKVYKIPLGGVCTFKWTDELAHCVTFKKPNPMNFKGTAQVTQRGYVYKQKFTKPGTYKITCCVHLTFMKATVTVAPASRRAALEQAPVCQSSCNGKCYGGDGCGGACPFPQRRSEQSCAACCTLGRSGTVRSVQACIKRCKNDARSGRAIAGPGKEPTSVQA